MIKCSTKSRIYCTDIVENTIKDIYFLEKFFSYENIANKAQNQQLRNRYGIFRKTESNQFSKCYLIKKQMIPTIFDYISNKNRF